MYLRIALSLSFPILTLITGCATNSARPRQLELTSLTGQPLYSLAFKREHISKERFENLNRDLVQAFFAYMGDRDDPQKLIWAGRRFGYVWRMHEAVRLYTNGIDRFPDKAAMYRHRGHRYISLRQFDLAIADLEQASKLIDGIPDVIEQDGMPNERNIPLTTLGFNVWYHLSLARYLAGDFEGASDGWRKTMTYTRHLDDNVVAVSDWWYMTLRRLGRDEEARALLEPITEAMEIIENFAYHRRLLMYKGLVTPDELLHVEGSSDLDLATLGYGLGNWHLCNGDREKAIAIFQRVLDGTYWPAFGYIASEVEMARLQEAS